MEACRQEDFNGPPEELAPAVAEHPFGLGVDQADASLAVHDDERVGCELEQVPEQGRAHRGGLLLGRDIAAGLAVEVIGLLTLPSASARADDGGIRLHPGCLSVK